MTERDLTIAAGTIEAGMVAALKMSLDGIVHGRPAIVFELIWRITETWHPSGPRATAAGC